MSWLLPFLNAIWRSITNTSKKADLKRILTLALILSSSGIILSQQADKNMVSIHQLQSEYFSSLKSAEPYFGDAGTKYPENIAAGVEKKLTRRVLGWHPYWISTGAYGRYDYESLSHIAYFSYEVDTATGGYTTIHDWNSTPVIDFAHKQGTKVLLTVTNFGSSRNTELLTDSIKQIYLINTLISLLESRNGDGVNFDLESVPAAQRSNTVQFIGRAVKRIKARLPESEISMATPAVDWQNAWDLKSLSQLCDYLIVMGYDYYWKGSNTAGPVAPLEGETYNVTRTLDYYLSAGVPPGKLMLGVPWYGYDWPVINSSRKAPATGTATARIFTAAEQLADTHGKIYDPETKVPWVKYSASPAWRQLWFDDPQSLGLKYSLVNSKNLAGIGIWALGYEDGNPEMWNRINTSFSSSDTTSTMIMNIYPNPVSESATIVFTLAKAEEVVVELFDAFGRKIMILASLELEAGVHTQVLIPQDLATGVYLCVLRTGSSRDTRKIVITKR